MSDLIDPPQDLLEIKCHDDYKWAAIEIKRLREALRPADDAPTDNGIEELDALCQQFNNLDIDLRGLVCRIWNNQQARIERLSQQNREQQAEIERLRKIEEKAMSAARYMDEKKHNALEAVLVELSLIRNSINEAKK